MAATSLRIAASGLPALSHGSSRRQMLGGGQGQVTGLRVASDTRALRSAFYNAGSSITLPDIGGSSLHRVTMRVASKEAYICRDCGYIYSDRKPFEKLPHDFFCPVCGAPKRRFKPYDAPVTKNANNMAVRKARKAELKKDSALGGALPIGIAAGLAVLLGVFLYLNGAY